MFDKQSDVVRVLVLPNECVTKGEYLLLDDGSGDRVVVQVIDEEFVDIPGLLEDVIREAIYAENGGKDDPLGVAPLSKMLRDSRFLLCKIRGVIRRDGKFETILPRVPSRVSSRISRVSVSTLLSLVLPHSPRKILLGKDLLGNDIYINADDLDGSLTVITGMKGSGKSHLAKVLMLGLIRHGAPVLIFDINGEYVKLGYNKVGTKNEFYDKIKVFRPGENVKFSLSYLGLETLTAVLTTIMGLPAPSSRELAEIWRAAERRGEVTLEALIEMTERYVGNLWVRDALISRLLALKRSGLITTGRGTRVEELLDSISSGGALVFVLRNLPPLVVKLAVEITLRKIVELLEVGKLHPLFLLAEEAHLYISETRWDDIITRMRHLGIFTIFVTNQPDALGTKVYRQMDNIFLFTFKNDSDLDLVSRASKLDQLTITSLVRDLARGYCLIAGRIVGSLPCIVKVRDLETETLGLTKCVWSVRHVDK